MLKKIKNRNLDLGQILCQYLDMRKTALAAILVTSLLVPVSAQAATAKAGAACPKLKNTQIVGSKKFTCVKSGKKLVWDKGVAITKPVVKKSQSIEFPPLENAYLANKALELSKAISTGGLAVSYSASGACTFDAKTNLLSLNKLGTCSVTTSQAGNASYLAATPITRTFEISKSPQQILPPSIGKQDLFEVEGTAYEYPSYGSSAPVLMTSRTPQICSIDGINISFLAVGICQITFSKAGDGEYEDAKPVDVTFEIFSSAVLDGLANPAGLGEEVINAGVSVTVDAINEEVSEAVCEADSANEACLDEDGIGVFDPELGSRYVEIVLTVTNDSESTWIADQLTLQLGDETFDFTSVYTIDSMEGLELEPGDSITGSYFVLLPNELDSAQALIIYGNTEEEIFFFFKAK